MIKFSENKKINALLNKASEVEPKGFGKFFKVDKFRIRFVHAM